MTAVDGLVDYLERRPSVEGATVVGWRFEVVEGQAVRAGVRDSQLGGPYEGPGVATALGGPLELHWSDGLLTRARLDRRGVTDPAGCLDGWRVDAAQERNGRLPPLVGPTVLPDVEVFDPAVDAVVTGRATTFLGILSQVNEGCSRAGVRRVDAVHRATRVARTVATSRGFRAAWTETSYTLDIWADEIAGASYARRCLPDDDDLARLVEQAAVLSEQLADDEPLPSTARGVLFMPGVVQNLLERLLLPNLSGRAIRDGRSPFTRTDLEQSRSILRDDLSLTVDTTLPFAPATAPFGPGGVPAGRVALIADGRLASPVLDLATAAEFGLPPTPVPRGRPHALLTSASADIGFDEALELLGDGVVVRDLPGLHTQQARRAAYALVAPDAQAVVVGEARGRCAVRLAGGLLGHLRQPSTALVRIPGDLSTGLLVLTGVELLPA